MNTSLEGAAFNDAYTALNEAQKKAVDTIDGPVMVIAGPGTGKTQILTLRIANIIKMTDTTPDSILALTFTESGAKAMRERLIRYIGSAAYRVTVTTFHAFCSGLIKQYQDAYPSIVGGQLLTDLDQIKIIEDILESGDIDILRPSGNPSYYVKPLISILSDLKREYLTSDGFSEVVSRQEQSLSTIEQFHTTGARKGVERGEYKEAVKSIEKNRALLTVFRLYESALRQGQLFDYDDMIVQTVAALTHNEDMLRDVQERYQYLLADEHQDVNGAQNQILSALAGYHDQPNIFVVGDEKQAIYRFQGASLDNFLYFESHFSGTTVITLTENYRSGQSILDAAHDLIAVEDGPLVTLRTPLTAAAVKSADVNKYVFEHEAIEDQWLVDDIRVQITAGVRPQEIAVIVRSNKEVESIAARLRAAGVEVSASAESDILTHPITRQVESLMRAVALTDDRAVFEQLHNPSWNIPPAVVMKVCAARRYNRSLVSVVTQRDILDTLELSKEEVEQIITMGAAFEEAQQRSVTDPPHEVLAWLLDESGLKAHILKRAPFEASRVIRRLYDEIEGMVRRNEQVTISGVLESFTQRRLYRLPLSAPFIATQIEAVQVMTAHKSKGLEFEHVYAPHLFDASWGGKQKRNLFKIPTSTDVPPDQADDEKRLLYVVMTRAKQRLCVSYSEQNTDGRPLTPSRLLADIDTNLIQSKKTDAYANNFSPLGSIVTPAKRELIDVDVARTLFLRRGFSATSLNNFITNPYNYYFRNLLQIPEVQTTPLLYGTAVHEVLQRYVQKKQTAGDVSDTDVVALLAGALERLPISAQEYTRLHKKALETIVPYVAHIDTQLGHKTETEYTVTVDFPIDDANVPHIPLKGQLDRLDFDDDGSLVQVVDYKTGKPRSRNAIEGRTSTSDGGYKRQLVFYALLLDLHNDERYHCRTSVLSFVESATHKIKEEVFHITDSEISDLRECIDTAVRSMLTGSWVEADPTESEYAWLLQ